MTEQLENEQTALEGVIDTPHQRSKLFHNYNVMLDWLSFSRPSMFQVNSGVVNGKVAWEIVYVASNGGE
jgi:hypothetical protein